MRAQVDATAHSVIVWCALCPTFAESVNGLEEAEAVVLDHERRVHPEVTTARAAVREKRRTRVLEQASRAMERQRLLEELRELFEQ